MEILLIVAVLAILAQTSYLTYQSLDRSRIERGSILMDTSALIDGRILPIARSGLISAPIIVPKSVVAELQFMADKADHDKRERARFGLDVIDSLQHLDGLTVRVVDDRNTDQTPVDEQLMKLSLQHKARLCTIDYNLNKAARVQKIDVINVNELAHALRVVHLPGEQTIVKVVQAGQERDQGVGYLDDGTMMVVEDGRSRIGQEVEVLVTRVLQTAAGKMAFSKPVGNQPRPAAKPAQEAKKADQRPAKQRSSKSQRPATKQRPASKPAAETSQPAEQKKPAGDERKKRPNRKRLSPQAKAESKLIALANQQSDD